MSFSLIDGDFIPITARRKDDGQAFSLLLLNVDTDERDASGAHITAPRYIAVNVDDQFEAYSIVFLRDVSCYRALNAQDMFFVLTPDNPR